METNQAATSMTKETEDLATDLKAIAGELWPYRPIAQMSFSDEILALGVLVRRQLGLRIKKLPLGFPEGAEPPLTARTRGRQELVD